MCSDEIASCTVSLADFGISAATTLALFVYFPSKERIELEKAAYISQLSHLLRCLVIGCVLLLLLSFVVVVAGVAATNVVVHR